MDEHAGKFWLRVKKSDNAKACWEWQLCCNDFGYGIMRLNGRNERAHRIAYTLCKGEIPKGMHVLHSCDNPPCCNPDHLRLGTDADNARDRIERGRAVNPPIHIGTANPSAKLNEQQVIAIRNSNLPVKDLAEMYNVRPGTINFILSGQTWRHLLNA